MNEYEIYIVDGKEVRVEKKDLESFKSNFPNATLKPDFQTPTAPGAVVEETTAPDMEFKSENGSSDFLYNRIKQGDKIQDPYIEQNELNQFNTISIDGQKFIRTNRLNEPGNVYISDNDFDAAAELSTAGSKFKAGVKRRIADISEIPAAFNRAKFAVASSVASFFLSDEQKEKYNKLSPEEQDKLAQTLGSAGNPFWAKITEESQEFSAKLRKEAESLEKNFVEYDNTISQAFKEGEIVEGTTRLFTEVIATIPSVMQAMIPYIGIPSIVGGSAAEASREAVYDEGKKIDLEQQLYSLGIGFSEGLLELTTKKIGTTAFKSIIGKPKEAVRKTLLQTATGIAKAGGKEGASELATLTINKLLESKYYDDAGLFTMSEQRFNEWWNEAGDTFLIGMATGKSVAGAGATGGVIRNAIGDKSIRKTLEKTNVNEISEAFIEKSITDDAISLSRNVFTEQRLNEELQKKVNTGEISLNESNEIKINFKNAQAAIKLADNINIAPSLINETVNLIQERNNLSNIIKQAGENKALVFEETNRLKEIDTRLAEISKENISIRLDEKIEKLEKPIKPPGSLMADPLGIITAADKLRQVKLEEAKQTKISNEVQKIYEEKGTEGAFEIIEKFKPITNKLVRKRREAPNYDEQLLRDEIETGERGIFDLIREYKPESGIPLSGYINKFLPARAIEASKRVLGEEFTQDVTEIRESKIELDDTTQEVLDFVRTEPKAKEQLRDIAGITKESVQKDATEILKGKLPGIVEKSGRDQNEILTAINNASKLKISDSVLEEMGGNFKNTEEQNSRFATFLDTNYDAIIKSIPDAVKNKLPVFEKIDTGKREKTKEGKKIFEYKTPTKEQMLSFYTEGGLTTLRARKLKLADILAQEIGKDAIAEVLADPNIQKEFLERQELLGKEIPQDAIPRLLQRIDRYIESIDTKSDGTLAMGISPVLIKRAFKGGLKVFRATLKKTNDFQKALTAFIKKVKTYFKSAEEGKIAEEVIKENVTIDNIESLDLDAMIDEVAKRVNTNRGIAYERVIYSNAANVKNPLFKIIGEQTEKGGAADIQFEIAGKRFDVEAKLESPQYSSINGQYNFNNKVFTNSKNTKISEGLQITLDNILEKAKPALDKYKQRATELGVNLETSGSKMPIDIFNQLKEEGLQNNITTREVVSQSVIEELYNKKDQYYIQIKGKGLYYIGKNPLNLPVPKLEGDVTITFRIARSSRDKNNNVTPTLRFLPDDINITSKKSDHSIDTANGINKLLKSDNILDLIAKQKSIEKYNSKDLNKDFNKFLEKSTGIGAEKVFSKAKAEARAKTVRKGFGDYFVPPGAEDFAGLMHKTLAKGKEGEKQLKFYQDNLYTPYNVANENITRERAAMFEDFRALKKKLSNVPKKLKQFTKGGDFTNDQAVRVYMWNKLGQKVPGLSETDLKSLVKEVSNDKELLQFADELLSITKGDGYVKPENNWMAGNIATDLMGLMNSTKRSKHLEVWQNNVDQIFSEQNLNKLEAAYGKEWITNLKKTLERMKIGSNRKWGGDKVLQSYLDWVNGSVGAIMFLNTRSAVLQTISNINYLNFSDNNPLKAAKAFANQKQYWSDFKTIFNSDYLQERRGGNKINVNESELALAAEKGGIQGTISLLLNKGFIFTKIADSFAIASGGATMYRNRINKYIKEGLSEKEATEKAFVDFKAITEETQQSSRPDRISEQQASNAGRLFLAFANTPMQYNRIIKKNAQDLIAGRGNRMEKVSKIIYYSTIQNLIFNALQKGLFALAFSEDDEDEKEIEKYSQVANGMADSLLRGMGMTGNAAVAVKNIATDISNRMDRPRPNFQDAAWKALTISPPIYSKVSKLRGAGYSLGYTTPENIFEPKLDNPALSAGANIISATTNIPLDRALRKAQNIEAAMSDEAEWWQRTALLMGWGSWELGIKKEKDKKEKKSKTFGKKFGKTFGKKF